MQLNSYGDHTYLRVTILKTENLAKAMDFPLLPGPQAFSRD
jgi:hypothetical protein